MQQAQQRRIGGRRARFPQRLRDAEAKSVAGILNSGDETLQRRRADAAVFGLRFHCLRKIGNAGKNFRQRERRLDADFVGDRFIKRLHQKRQRAD